jgi:tripartite-type tricarboxylate transporter receptor subunit TctC
MKAKRYGKIGLAAGLSMFLVLAAWGGPTAWAKYPEKNIKVIVHVSPGGGTDLMARIVVKYLGKKLGTNFIVENQTGAGGQVGWTALSLAKPDGYTIGTSSWSIATHELTRKNVPYKLQTSFAPIACVVLDPSGAFVLPTSPFKTLADLVAAAKKNPGKINWGGTFLWGAHHVHLLMLQKAAGIKLTYVPFDGVAESRTSLLGGHVDVGSSGASEYAELVKQGKLRGLAIAAPKRMAILPDVPTYKELGYKIQIGSDRGFIAPAGTPKECIQILSQGIGEVMKDPEFLVEAKKVGIVDTLLYLNAEEFKEDLLNRQEIMRETLKDFKKKK